MSIIEPQVDTPPQNKKILRTVLLTLPMLLLIGLMVFQGSIPKSTPELIAKILTFSILNVVFIMMMLTGKTYKYRATLFTLIAFCFCFGFISNLIEIRGSMAIDEAHMLAGETPFCHLVIPMIIIPAALTRTIIFPGSLMTGYASIAGMIVLWLGATLVLGRGWCSWVCFFGGFDEGFSRLRKQALIKKIDPRWTYLPWAVLIVIVLLSALLLTPVYCEWLCPFKTVTEFVKITSFKTLVQTIIFVSLFLGLVVVMPLLTRRRIQCGLFCPFAAFQSLFNKVNIFDIRINQEQCKLCKKCINECPTFSLNEGCVKDGTALMSCTKCGQCVDTCPRGAVTYHIKGTPVKLHSDLARVLFIYPAYIFMTAIGGSMIVDALTKLIKLVSTGSMF
jgi:Polyferredoxin